MAKNPDKKVKARGKAKSKAGTAAMAPSAAYEAAQPTRVRKFRRDRISPDQLVRQGTLGVRDQLRYLQRNHDIVRGIIRTMVNNVVGPTGIGVEPQPRRADGSIHAEYAKALLEAYRDWQRCPEVTHRHHWAKCQRLAAGTWFRDGEMFSQLLKGNVPFLDHGTRVPFSVELFEADMVPMDLEDPGRNLRQGIERNAWGQLTGVWVYKNFPGDNAFVTQTSDAKRIPGANVLQLAALDRIGQLRGVSELASVVTRSEDIKDLEESERVAAKLAARLTAYVRKGDPTLYDPSTVQKDEEGHAIPRELSFDAGTIIDGLGMGEEISIIDSKRPNPNIYTWRQGQLRAVAAGAGASYSSIAKDYEGTYSGMRQELVEQWVNYAVLTDEFVGQWVQPIWEQFVWIADASGIVPIPADVVRDTADDCLFVGQSMPWIDPVKEANAWQILVKAGFASELEVMRRRGVNPRDVLEQLVSWREDAKSRGLVLSSDAIHDKVAQLAAGAEEPANDSDREEDERPRRPRAKGRMGAWRSRRKAA